MNKTTKTMMWILIGLAVTAGLLGVGNAFMGNDVEESTPSSFSKPAKPMF